MRVSGQVGGGGRVVCPDVLFCLCACVFDTNIAFKRKLDISNNPTSKHVSCVTFHPSLGRVFLGFKNASVQTCSALDSKTLSSFKVHSDFVTNIRCAANGRVLLSSWDKTASIVTFEGDLPSSSTVRLIGHTAGVNDIILLS